MKAARFRISGLGELEKEWKRLLGWRRALPETVGEGVEASPGGVRIAGGSFSTVWF